MNSLTVLDVALDLSLTGVVMEFPVPVGHPGQGVNVAASALDGTWAAATLAVEWVDAAGRRHAFDPPRSIGAGGGAVRLTPDDLVAVDRVAVVGGAAEAGLLARITVHIEQKD